MKNSHWLRRGTVKEGRRKAVVATLNYINGIKKHTDAILTVVIWIHDTLK